MRFARLFAREGLQQNDHDAFELFKKAASQDESSPASVAGWIRSRKASSLLTRNGAKIADLVTWKGLLYT